MRRSLYRHLSKSSNEPAIPDKFNQIMSNFGLTAVEAVGLTIPENLSNDPVTKAVYDNILGNIPAKKKVTVYCNICSLEFSSQVVLDTHIAGSKHQRKLKSKDLMKNLEETESGFERNSVSGVIRCTVCDVTVNSPQLLATHVAGNKHKNKKENKAKRENGEEGGTPAKKIRSGATDQSNGTKKDATNGGGPPKKKERAPLELTIPSYVTKLEDTKAGGKFLCNPCQAHCNSDVQLSQHLTSKKHLEKDNFSCTLCNLHFSSRAILGAHLSGGKHQKKVRSEDILKLLARTDPTCGRDRTSGALRCSLCNVTVMAAHVLKKHSLSREHRMNKGEDVSNEPEEELDSMNGGFLPPKKKEKVALSINIPDCVTKSDEGGVIKYFCNPCMAHCNSDVQLHQHITSKKHLDKVSGKKKPVNPVPRWKGGPYGKGRGAPTGPSTRWDPTISISNTSAMLMGAVGNNYGQQQYPETSFANYTDSYGLSSLGRASASDYSVGGKAGMAAGIGGGGRGRADVAGAYGRNDIYARPEGAYGRGAPAYGKPEAYPRTAEYSTDYHHGKTNDYNAYARQSQPYPNPGYGQGGHTAARGGVYTYTQPLSHNFVTGGKVIQ